MSMSVWRTLTTALRIATTLLAATCATVMMDTLWTQMTCTPAMVFKSNNFFRDGPKAGLWTMNCTLDWTID